MNALIRVGDANEPATCGNRLGIGDGCSAHVRVVRGRDLVLAGENSIFRDCSTQSDT